MDNLTHGLMGVAVGMLRRREGGPEHDKPLTGTDKAVFWATLMAAELPDIDVFFGGGIAEYQHHRGWTHAVLTAPLVALVATAATKLIWRDAKAGKVYGWSLGAVLIGHLLNDFMTGWGTRVLIPLNEVRYGLDWIPIVDLLYTVPLILMAWMAYRKPQVRQKWAIGTLVYLLIYCFGYRGISHTVVDNRLAQQYDGRGAVAARVSPDLLNPLRWTWVVDLGDRFEQGTAYAWTSDYAVTRVTPKLPADDPVVQAVRQASELAPFFAQFAYVDIQYEATADGYKVSMGDVRYRFGGRDAGMTTVVYLDGDLKVTRVD